MESRPVEDLGFSERRLSQVAQVAERYIQAGAVSGVVVGILRHGAIAQLSAHGLRDISSGAPMATDTLFRIYSMTKPLTTAAALLLYERALIRLTDSLSTFFPGFREMEVYLAGEAPPFRTTRALREITIGDLLTHTAGLAYGIGDEHPVEKEFERTVWGALASDPELSLAEMASMVADLPLVHQPGTHWRYSIACDLLAAVVEQVTRTPFAEFLTREILQPLGMEESWFTVPEAERARLAVVYEETDAGLEPSEDPPVMSYLRPRKHANGGGGLVSTATDYLRFARMLLEGGKNGDGHLLSPQTVRLMMTNHLPPGIAGWDRPGMGFGYGGDVVTDPGQIGGYGRPGRYSWGGAASTLFWVEPELDLAAVLMLQRVPGFSSLVTNDLATSIYQAVIT